MVDAVLKITLGLFVKKARSLLCEKLKEGGINALQLRGLIMSNLQDIQTKLAGLARGSLLTSASNLQEGLRLLDALELDEPNTPTISRPDDDNIVEDNPDGARKLERVSSSEDSLLNVNAALELKKAIDKIKINSSDHFVSAMKLFENANTEATRAFHNEALSVEDRVLATKLRVQSRILLSLENPSLAEQPCRLYLEELHGLSSLVETFRNYLEGGIMSIPNKKKRRKLVLSVTTINFVVLNFLKRFSKDPIILFHWPSLQVDSWMYNPVISDKTIFAEMQSIGGFLFPNLAFFDLENPFDASTLDFRSFCVNSVGHLISKKASNNAEFEPPVLVKSVTSESKTKVDHFSQTYCKHERFALAIDIDDNVYYLSVYKDNHYETESALSCELIAVDSTRCPIDSYQLCKSVYDKDSCPAMNSTPLGFAVAIRRKDSPNHEVTLFRNDKGRIKKTSSFQAELWASTLITVTRKSQVVAVEKSGHRVRVFEEDGQQLIPEFELYGGKNELCVSVAFNHLTGEVIFITLVRKCYFLSTYYIAETSERRRKVRLSLFGEDEELHLTSHCKGPIAIVSPQLVLYLQ